MGEKNMGGKNGYTPSITTENIPYGQKEIEGKKKEKTLGNRKRKKKYIYIYVGGGGGPKMKSLLPPICELLPKPHP